MVRAVRPLRSLSMARGCARIDSRPDTAKIGSVDRVEVHHARLLAVIGVRKTFPHGLGPRRKWRHFENMSASLNNRHSSRRAARLLCANNGSRAYSITLSPRASTWLRWSFGQPGLPQSFFVSQKVFGPPKRAQHVFESGNT